MNQYQNQYGAAWNNYVQGADQQAQPTLPNGVQAWQTGQPMQMQQWNFTPQPPTRPYQDPAWQQQAPGSYYQTPGQYWTPQEAGGNQQSYQPWPQWQNPNTALNSQTWQARQIQEEGFGQGGFDLSIGGLIFAIFIAAFLVWFGWRRKIQAVDEPSGIPVTRNDRRMLSLAEALNTLCNKTK